MFEECVKGIITRAVLKSGSEEGWPLETIQSTLEKGLRLEWPKKEEFGDLSTPLVMGLSKGLGKPPRVIAEKIVTAMKDDPSAVDVLLRVEVAGPGYINLTFSSPFLYRYLESVIGSDSHTEKVSSPRAINVEFVSANPTGPLHVGHGRGAAFGDSLARILREAGHRVSTEYYINDAGNQMNMLGKSVYLAFRRLEGRADPEERVRLLGDGEGYRGDYIPEIAQRLREEKELIGDAVRKSALEGRFTEDVQDAFTHVAQTLIMSEIRNDLSRFGVSFDRFFSEKTLHIFPGEDRSRISHWIDLLEQEPGGMVFESEGALWFKTTVMNDDKDRVLKKSDGSYTYFAADIAYHADKVERGFDTLVDVWGADHHGYQARMQAVVRTLAERAKKNVDLRICLIQLVSLMRNGKAVSMSTRAGEYVTLGEVLDEVGVDATRFSYLTRSHESPLEFDLAKAKERSMDNPVFYVQYAHARVKSLLAQASLRNVALEEFSAGSLSVLSEQPERSLIRLLAQFSGVILRCAESFEVHPLTDYLTAVAGAYHHYYFHHRILSSEEKDRPVMLARIGLSIAVAKILKKGLSLLGVSAPDSM